MTEEEEEPVMETNDIGIEEQPLPDNVTIHYDVGPGHELYDADATNDSIWQEIRMERDASLSKVDICQGILFYESLTNTQKQDLANYRQALLDWPNDYDDVNDALSNQPQRPDWMTH